MNQRWRERRNFFVPESARFDPARYDVEPIDSDAQAKAFVQAHHYSGSYPAARFRFGLFGPAGLAGVAVFSHPCNNRSLTRTFEGLPLLAAVELGRFVLLDQVGFNGETWFLARAFELLAGEGLRGVLSCSDPTPRSNAAGELIFPGHLGTIYQAHNGVLLPERTKARWLRLLPDGTVFSDRAAAKIRARVKGWRYATAKLIEHGAEEPGEDLTGWLQRWLPRLTRPLRHPGNLRYAWGLDRWVRRRLPKSIPYPKRAK